MDTYKQNDLFRRGPQTRLNACVGTNGGPYDFGDYARGYFMAARNQLAAIVESSGYIDILVYPLAYSYRHGIELGLKHLAIELAKLYGTEVAVKPSHKLRDNWEIVKPYLNKQRRWFDCDGTVPYVESVLADFLEFDASAEVFRYPEDRRGDLHLQDASIINVEVLGHHLNRVGEIFVLWFERTRDAFEYREDLLRDE